MTEMTRPRPAIAKSIVMAFVALALMATAVFAFTPIADASTDYSGGSNTTIDITPSMNPSHLASIPVYCSATGWGLQSRCFGFKSIGGCLVTVNAISDRWGVFDSVRIGIYCFNSGGVTH